MRNMNDRDGKAPRRSRITSNIAILGTAAVLGVAALSAYAISGKDASVKPASGAAQAMALASSKPATR